MGRDSQRRDLGRKKGITVSHGTQEVTNAL